MRGGAERRPPAALSDDGGSARLLEVVNGLFTAGEGNRSASRYKVIDNDHARPLMAEAVGRRAS